MVAARILVIDDEKNIRRTLGLVLEGEGYEVAAFGTAQEGLAYLEKDGADLVILDIKLPGMTGVEALSKIRSSQTDYTDIPIIMISGHASLAEAVETVKRGATDFFEKPLDRDGILIRVANCLKQRKLAQEVQNLKAQVDSGHEMIGKAPVMHTLFKQLEKVAPTKSRVLITGESGTGKELIARALHDMSPRRDNPFIKVNCAAIPGELIESELFGYEKGAFTGAKGRKPGQFELADGGTLFLDEIGDMTLSAQAKVLRVLQSGELTRVGGQKNIHVDVRVLAATNKDLEKAILDGTFREDLYFRLNVVPLYSPPLRNRLADVPLMLESFINRFCEENGYPKKEIEEETLQRLCAYAWPGNVRELKNMAERLVIMSGESIGIDDLPEAIAGVKPLPSAPKFEGPKPSLKQFREEAERKYVLETLDENNWNISKAAQDLQIERTNLHKKIKSLGLKKED
ncbi:MAG: sigma-54-dependent Fis family transcriptional regulator [Deltaproteobacteria bacterium]|nr:sigma-54-dependent Fis family transcriptional regulator [Deltaproteobacteria bacterium]MBN2673821.1 sigma-54-dependent Fis family transcriptional regulator [Deltaproteobacteria bacterium]